MRNPSSSMAQGRFFFGHCSEISPQNELLFFQEYTTGSSFVDVLRRWASSLTITALNLLLPEIFEILTELEDWSPNKEVAVKLGRFVFWFICASAFIIINTLTFTIFQQYTTGSAFIDVLRRWASSLTITALNLILPEVFQILTELEDWSPNVEVAVKLGRLVFDFYLDPQLILHHVHQKRTFL